MIFRKRFVRKYSIYVWRYIWWESTTVFLTQHDVNVVYINHNSGEIGACISGDELHIIAKIYLIFRKLMLYKI